MFLILFLLYYRQMNRLNWASKRELNPSGYFCHVSLQRETFIFEQFVIRGDYGLFFGMFFGNRTDSSRCASQVLHKQRRQRRMCTALPLQTRKNGLSPGTRTCFPYLRFFPRLSWMSLKWTQAVPLCQKHGVTFYVVVVAVKL